MIEELDNMDEIVNDFVTETDELIEFLDNDLIALEKSPGDLELINKIFRAVHTVKGAAGFLGFDKMVDVVHHAEGVLNKCRQGQLEVTPQINDVILKAVDTLKVILDMIRSHADIDVDVTSIVQELKFHTSEPGEKEAGAEEVETDAAEEVDSKSMIGQMLVEEQKITQEQLEEALEEQEIPPKIGEILIEKNLITKEDLDAALKKQGSPTAPGPSEQTIRVDINRLDEVMNLVGELVLGRNRILQIGSDLEKTYEADSRVQSLLDTMAHINMVTSDLQLAVMKTRMQPIKKVFNRFPRMVRDLAKNMQKEINLDIEGEETELDKSVIEEIGDPLVHLVRNSIDHGVELPDEREAAGKPRQGNIKLSAFYEGNNIIIEISDDGKGMDAENIISIALEKGLVQKQDADRMSERDKLNLIYCPGFSTAREVSDISGRGVGMDVVRSNVLKLSGTINTATELGKGTVISIRLPLTVAIIQTLMVSVGEEIFALPLMSVLETVRTSPGSIQYVDRREVIRLRDEVLPLVRLEDVFDIETFYTTNDAANSDTVADWLYVVVIAVAEKKIGIVVDKLIGQEEVVIKSLGEYMQPKGIAGATILGSGKVTLIVDLGGLMDLIDDMAAVRSRGSSKKPGITREKGGVKKIILLVDDSNVARRSQKTALESAGYSTVEAENGLDAMEKLKNNPGIAGIVTDMLMPKMDGIEMTEKIKSDRRFKSLPVIAVSVADGEPDKERGFKAGVDDYFYKSDISGMIESVRRLVG
ncbi:MAG: chemotaxis protein A [bacterium]|nr:MAG: chemotaxis protein A [bacterium]